MKRRDFVKKTALGGLTFAAGMPGFARNTNALEPSTITIDPQPQFALSPWLYMQFMEPLGVTDSSVEAAWDHTKQCWKPELVEVTRELAPGMIRWGGLLSAYYRWKEAVGPRNQRKPMYNIVWGGFETNQVGTAEFIDFCRLVGADPLMCVNFESEGNPRFLKTPMGDDRCGYAQEAAEWVDYCNTSCSQAVPVEFRINGKVISSAKAFEIAEDPTYEILKAENDRMQTKTKEVTIGKPYTVPPASVTAVQLRIKN